MWKHQTWTESCDLVDQTLVIVTGDVQVDRGMWEHHSHPWNMKMLELFETYAQF